MLEGKKKKTSSYLHQDQGIKVKNTHTTAFIDPYTLGQFKGKIFKKQSLREWGHKASTTEFTKLLLLLSLKAGTIKVLRSTLSDGWSKKTPQETIGESVNESDRKMQNKTWKN